MPRYHYECTKCAHAFDLVEGWDAKPNKRCPECRAKAIRIPKAPAIVFKGKGFYASDNKSPSFKNRRDEEEKAARGESPTSAGDGDSAGSSGSDGAESSSNGSSSKETAPASSD